MADQQKVAYGLSNGAIFNDLNDLVFKVTPFFEIEYLTNGYDTATVTIEGEQETAPKLSNDTSFNDIE